MYVSFELGVARNAPNQEAKYLSSNEWRDFCWSFNCRTFRCLTSKRNGTTTERAGDLRALHNHTFLFSPQRPSGVVVVFEIFGHFCWMSKLCTLTRVATQVSDEWVTVESASRLLERFLNSLSRKLSTFNDIVFSMWCLFFFQLGIGENQIWWTARLIASTASSLAILCVLALATWPNLTKQLKLWKIKLRQNECKWMKPGWNMGPQIGTVC